MSRPLRIAYPGVWYHVMRRDRGRAAVFLSRYDYETFINVLQDAVDVWCLQTSACCLRSNRFHLLVRAAEGNISRCMRHIIGVYLHQRFNRHHKKDGPLFRDRYKAILVDAVIEFLEMLRPIHRNPLRAVRFIEIFSLKYLPSVWGRESFPERVQESTASVYPLHKLAQWMEGAFMARDLFIIHALWVQSIVLPRQSKAR